MAYVKVSIPKKAGAAGAPVPKDPNVIFVLVKDILNETGNYEGFPSRDGVKNTSASSLQLKAGATAIGVYISPLTINRWDTTEGDPDKVGHISNFTGEHPGDEADFAEFLQENVNEGFLIISRECSDQTGTRIQGTPCNPMQMTYEGQDNNEGKISTLTFAQVMRTRFKMMHYSGDLPDLAPFAGGSSGSSGI